MKPQHSKSAESKPVYFELFQHLHEQHDLILLDSEMQEIIRICEKLQPESLQTTAKEKEFCERLENALNEIIEKRNDGVWYQVVCDVFKKLIQNYKK